MTDKLGSRLNLVDVERQKLGITTIRAVDVDKAQLLERRKQKDRERKERCRRAGGAKPRAQYEAQSLSRTKPWEALGMKRAKWYRMGKP